METEQQIEKRLRDKYMSLEHPYKDNGSSARLKQKYASNYSHSSVAREGGSNGMPKRNFYCPYTKNRKFEVFLEDLFELGFNNDRNRQEIILYIQAVETYYTEKLKDLYARKH